MSNTFYAKNQQTQGAALDFSNPETIQKLKNIQNDPTFAAQVQKQLQDPNFQTQLQTNPMIQQQLMTAISDPSIQQQIAPFLQKADLGNIAAQFLSGGAAAIGGAGGASIQANLTQMFAQNLMDNILGNEKQKAADPQIAGGNPIDEEGKAQEGGAAQPTSWAAGIFARYCKCLTVEYYQEYFDVTTVIVRERLEMALYPLNTGFFQNGRKEDMYGPFWVYTTLIFTLAAAGNLSTYLSTGTATYNFSYVPQAASFVYLFGFGFPIVICYMMRLFGSGKLEYLKVICIYGYASAVYIPVSLACSLPYGSLQWALMLYATAATAYFLVRNFSHELEQFKEEHKKISLAVIAGLQIFLLILYKVYFFDSIYSTDKNSSSSLQTHTSMTASTHIHNAHHLHPKHI